MLRKLLLQPGINKEGTDYSAEGGWYDCDKVRFRKGRPEKIGGWVERSASTMFGVCRSLFNWVTTAGGNYLAAGTNAKFYLESGSAIFDITPSYNYGTSFLTEGINTTPDPTTIKITSGDIAAYNWEIGDVGRVSSPAVSLADGGVDSADDAGGSFEYVYISGKSAGDPDELTAVRGYFDSTVRKHSYNSRASKGPTIERIPRAEVTSAPTTVTTGGAVGVVDLSPTVLIRQEDHGRVEGDYVTFLQLGAAVSAGVTDTDFLTPDGFRVVRSLDADNYEIEIGSSSADSTTSNLNADITWTDLTAIVVTSSVFSGTNFWIRIEQEYIKIGSVSGATLTVAARGEFGSTAAQHIIQAGSTISVDEVDFVGSVNTYLLNDINSGSVAYLGASGWGSGAWGEDGWGDASDVLSDTFRTWSIDNWGSDLILCPRAGPPYFWNSTTNATSSVPNRSPASASSQVTELVAMAQAVPLNTIGTVLDPDYSGSPLTGGVPAAVRQIMVYPSSKQVIAFGCSNYDQVFNPMLVRWSSSEYPGSWDVRSDEALGTSGEVELSTGSQIIGACRSKLEVLIWTDSAIYTMQYAGGDAGSFSFSELASNISIMGAMAYVAAAGSIYWMGDRNFFVYNGSISVIPCTVLNYIFSDLNYEQGETIFAASNSEFNEVTFFYPSSGKEEVDRYATFNYLENLWTVGEMARTAWSDSGLREKPQSAFISDSDENKSKLYEQETGHDNVSVAMEAFIESAYFDIDDGDNFSFISRVIPDIKFTDGDNLTLKIFKKDFPNDDKELNPSTSEIMSNTTQKFVRVRGRQVAVRVETDGTNVGWRLGDTRLDIRPDGRR